MISAGSAATRAASWFAYLPTSSQDETIFWPREAIDSAVRETPQLVWEFVLQLIIPPPTHHLMAHVAAGALEDATVQQVVSCIEHIEAQARNDPRFRLALTDARCEGDISDVFIERTARLTSSVSGPL